MSLTTAITVTYCPPGAPDDDALRAACAQLREHLAGVRAEPGVVRARAGWFRPPWDSDDVTLGVCVTLDGPAGYRNVSRGYLLATRAVYLAGGTGLDLGTGHVDRVSVERVDEPAAGEAVPVELEDEPAAVGVDTAPGPRALSG